MSNIRIALFQPDIAGNAGAVLRLGACLGLGVDFIAPTGFDMSDRALRRAGMDYVAMASLTRHDDWASFEARRRHETRRLVLYTTRGDRSHVGFDFRDTDILLFGRESAGVPDHVRDAADERLVIPMPGGGRSLNLAMAVAIAASEATRSSHLTATISLPSGGAGS